MTDTHPLSRACTQAWEAFLLTGGEDHLEQYNRLKRIIWRDQDKAAKEQ